jgi:putative intracellular protease/amidase
MRDCPNATALAEVARAIDEWRGVVSAVCQGPAALVNLTLSDGSYMVAGKVVRAFTNEEERAVRLDAVVRFLLADTLIARGARHEGGPFWSPKVAVSERLVLGQSPASAAGVAEAVLGLLGAVGSAL